MIFQCSGVNLDTDSYAITKHGQTLSVTPKVFDLLVFLIRNRDRLVSRDELLDEIWRGRLIADAALSNEIKHARAVLGDDGAQQKYIRTVRGRGYQFVGEVIERSSTANPNDAEGDKANGLNASQSAPVASHERPTLAVLPFVNHSNEGSDTFFTDGFHDELITHLSRIREVATISRTSVMAYRDGNQATRAIGKALNATHIIEGGVLRIGNQVRVNVQLINARQDEQIWGDTYTEVLSAEQVFAIQGDIARKIVANLQAALSPPDQRNLAEAPTQIIEALEAYFRGRLDYGLSTSAGFTSAIGHFKRAIELDPLFAEAHAQLAMALLEKVHFGGHNVDAQNTLAAPVIERALTLKPGLSEAHEALGFLERHRGNFPAAEAAYERSLALNPDNTSALRMFGYFKSWDCEQPQSALTYLNRARLLDPQNHHTLALLGQTLMDLERFDEAELALTSAIEGAPTAIPTHQMLGQLNSWKLYRHDQAILAFQRAFSLDPSIPWTTYFLGSAYDELGMPDKAEQVFEWYLSIAPDTAFYWLVRLRLLRMRGDDAGERRFLESIIQGRVPIERWHDFLCFDGFDVRYSHPDLAVRFFETLYPELTLSTTNLDSDNSLFRFALAYATVLWTCGEDGKAEGITDKVLQLLPKKRRFRCRGIDLMDAWLYMSMGNEDNALHALQEWRNQGGCRDLTRARMASASLAGRAEFQALNAEIRAELHDQQENLSHLEESGELPSINSLITSKRVAVHA